MILSVRLPCLNILNFMSSSVNKVFFVAHWTRSLAFTDDCGVGDWSFSSMIKVPSFEEMDENEMNTIVLCKKTPLQAYTGNMTNNFSLR